jgi:membrane-bound lytic murein transglycosylase D
LIAKPVQLSAITKRTGISLEELKRLNPELRRNIVPRSKGLGYHLKVPMGMASLVAAHRSTFPIWTQPPPPPTQWYRIRRGDSLSVVARRFGMKVRQLKEMNNLSSNLIRVGRRLRVRTGVDDKIDRTATWYRVRYGDSLGRIANRFRISVRELKRFNNLSTNLIYPGDRLRVKEASVSQKSRTYRVRQGDSLWTIARQFRVSVRDLRTLNNLSSSIIRAGHMLIVSQ